MREAPASWTSIVGNSMDCFRDRVVRERVILLRRRDYGNTFEDVIATAFESGGSPEIIIKNNKNGTLEASRQALLALPIGSFAIAKLLLNAKYHDRSSNFWTCYMTSEFFPVQFPSRYLDAYASRTKTKPITPSPMLPHAAANPTPPPNGEVSDSGEPNLGPPVRDLLAAADTRALIEQLELERAARRNQDKRIKDLEFTVNQLSVRLDSMRAAMENFRVDILTKKSSKRRKVE